VRQLCDPGTLNSVTTVMRYKYCNYIMLQAYENIELTIFEHKSFKGSVATCVNYGRIILTPLLQIYCKV